MCVRVSHELVFHHIFVLPTPSLQDLHCLLSAPGACRWTSGGLSFAHNDAEFNLVTGTLQVQPRSSQSRSACEVRGIEGSTQAKFQVHGGARMEIRAAEGTFSPIDGASNILCVLCAA